MSMRKYQIAQKKLERMEREERGELTEEDIEIIRLNILKIKYLHKKSVPFSYPVMVYFHSKSMHMKCELDDILNLMKSDALKLESDYVRKEIKGDTEKIRLFFDKQKKFTPCGIFYARRNRIDIRQLNGIIVLEDFIENLSDEQQQLIKSDPYTYAFFRQLENDKYAILVKTTGITSKNYKSYQLGLLEHYRKLINNYSLLAFNINRSICLSNDTELYRSNTIKYYSSTEHNYKI